MNLNKLYALVNYTNVEEVRDIIKLIENEECFHFFESCGDFEAVAKKFIADDPQEYFVSDLLEDYIDYEQFGEDMDRDHDGKFVREGYVCMANGERLEDVLGHSSECFDDNKAYLHKRIEEENNPKVKALLKKDMEFLDHIQIDMATARQFLFIARCKNMKQEQVFNMANRVEKVITEQGFEVRRMKKEDIKRFLAIYFDASMNGELMPDTDGEQFSAFIDKDSVERVK